MNFGRNIRAIRKRYNFTQTEVANAMKIHRQEYSLIELSPHIPTKRMLKRLSKVLRIPEWVLLVMAVSPDVPVQQRAMFEPLLREKEILLDKLLAQRDKTYRKRQRFTLKQL